MVILARNPLTDLFRPLKKRTYKRISDFFDPQLISFLDVETRNEATDVLIDLLDKKKKLPDKEAFRKAIHNREQLVSTGIGMGIAIPHAKMKDFDDFFIAVGIQQKRGLEWNALDKAPVRLIFMIGGPDDKQSEYLQILSMLTSKIKEPDLRKNILRASTAQEVLHLFSNG